MKVIITIPAYNEEKDIASSIRDIKEAMDKTKYKYQVLVVDDGSTDSTVKKAKTVGATVVSNKRNLGLSLTFLREMKECLARKADIIVHSDADGQYPAKFIPQLIKKVEQGADLVLGSRFGKGSYSGSWMKKVGNKAFASAFSGMLRTKITDTTTGFRAFTPEVARLPLINEFTYTQEQLIRAHNAHLKIEEVPITTNETRPSRLFANSFDYAFRAWINILRIYRDFAPLKFFGKIGLLFMGAGALLGCLVLYSVLTTGAAGGIPRVILSVLLITVGIQIGLFGFLADMMKK